MIHTFKVGILTLLYTFRYGIPILARARWASPRLRDVCGRIPRRWAELILKAAGVEVLVEGAEHLRRDAPQILVLNHQSWFDILALTAYLPVDYRFVAKKELEGIPIFGSVWQACGHISIDRDDLQKSIGSLERAAEVVRRERPTLIMFPEGTRSMTGELAPFKKGAFVLAIRMGAPVVPAAILGTREVMLKGDWRVRPGKVRIRIGAPIPVQELGHHDRDALARAARDAVAQLKDGAPLEGPWERVVRSERSSSRRRMRDRGGDRAADRD